MDNSSIIATHIECKTNIYDPVFGFVYLHLLFENNEFHVVPYISINKTMEKLGFTSFDEND